MSKLGANSRRFREYFFTLLISQVIYIDRLTWEVGRARRNSFH